MLRNLLIDENARPSPKTHTRTHSVRSAMKISTYG